MARSSPGKVCFVQIGTQSVRYRTWGSGEPVVLVHGLGGSGLWYKRNIEELARRFTVYAVDLPGFGATRRLRGEPFTVNGAAAWLRLLLEALALGPVHLVAHSMGGLIALLLAVDAPSLVRKLVLSAPPVALPVSRKANILPLLGTIRRTALDFAPVLFYDAWRAGPFTIWQATGSLLACDIEVNWRRSRRRCFLLWGEHDSLVPISAGHILTSSIPGSLLQIIPGAGHVVMWDQPRLWNDAVLRFLCGS